MLQGETVLLVHGLWMHGLVMRVMRRRLESRGYAVHAYSYPTIRLTMRENADRFGRYCNELNCGPLHFVAHSMGGLVALNAAQKVPVRCRGRIVVMGTPYADSYSGRQLEALPGGRWLLGNGMAQWLHEPHPEALEGYEIGVIAGSGGVGMGRLVAPGLPRPNDGVVAVDETRVPGMRDHIVLEVSHTAMLFSREVVRQTCAFLDHGAFERPAA